MKRTEFFEFMNGLDKSQEFEMSYKKINGEMRVAKCRLRDEVADRDVKGTGMNRQEKMDKHKLLQYFDLNKNAYRSAKLENIINVIINEEVITLED